MTLLQLTDVVFEIGVGVGKAIGEKCFASGPELITEGECVAVTLVIAAIVNGFATSGPCCTLVYAYFHALTIETAALHKADNPELGLLEPSAGEVEPLGLFLAVTVHRNLQPVGSIGKHSNRLKVSRLEIAAEVECF